MVFAPHLGGAEKKIFATRTYPPYLYLTPPPTFQILGAALPWVDEVRYLGVFMKSSGVFKCSLDHAKKSFYRAANAIFGKVGRIASEEVVYILQLNDNK